MAGGSVTGADREIQSVSTRIALDGGTETCTDCGNEIASGERHKVAAVRDESRIVHRTFCGRDCLEAWQSAAAVVE